MEYQATTVELDNTGFESLQKQILDRKNAKVESTDIREREPEQQQKHAQAKKYVFKKGDQSFELDDDYELEFMADKKPTKLTLKELRERAAGDIAVKNRMHSLAEEKKKVSATLKEFADLAKTDALGALEYISRKAQESDSEFEYEKYLEMLAEQAEKLGQMDEKDRKALELEKKLKKAEQDLSHKARVETVVLRKQEILSDYPEIGDQQFSEMVESVMENEVLMEGVETEDDVMDRVEELIQETLIQKDIISVIEEIDPSHRNDTDLIFYLSDQIKQNPDFDEEDVRHILSEVLGRTQQRQEPVRETTREKDIKTLSQKARESGNASVTRNKNMSDYEILQEQLLERKKQIQKTPLYAR